MNKIMDLDKLVISFLDLEANKGLFRKDLARKLNILPSDIEVSFGTEYTGVVHQYIQVDINETLSKDDLDKIDFDYIDNNGNLIFEVGDVML